MIWPVVDEALRAAGTSLHDLSAIAVCHGPGLIGSLLVGCSFAKALSFTHRIPLVSVNHLEGHILSCFLEHRPEFPFVSLIVSGGHTSLYRVDAFGSYRELGRTRDDAAGEAYDKIAKVLGLGYPGGPAIDQCARSGNAEAVEFPRAYLPESLDFSFSGIKTAVVQYLRNGETASVEDICASFQRAMVDVLVRKTEWALRKEGAGRVTLSGGVDANSLLREEFSRMAEGRGAEVFIPSMTLCTDNAAMIAAAGYHRYVGGERAGMDLNPAAYLPL